MSRPFIPVLNTIQVHIITDIDALFMENTLYFQREGAVDLFSLGGIVNALAIWHKLEVMSLLGSNLHWNAVSARDLTTISGLGASNGAFEVMGGAATEALPTNVCARVWFETGIQGASYRGSNFVPGVPRGVVVDNTIDADFLGALTSAYNELLPIAADRGWAWCVVSFMTAGVYRTAGLVTPIVSSYVSGASVRS